VTDRSIRRMSRVVPCPQCGSEVSFSLLSSIDAGRDPDLRRAILDRSLQQKPCRACGTAVRPPPAFMYFDRRCNLWVAAYAWEKRAEWGHWEQQTQENFETVYRSGSSIGRQMQEAPVNGRVTFGWEALREKIVAADLGIDDVSLEICKRHWTEAEIDRPDTQNTECRLLGVTSKNVVLGQIAAESEQIISQRKIERALFEEQLAAGGRDRALRKRLTRGMFVDVARLRVKSM
jgi:hypothetical protein